MGDGAGCGVTVRRADPASVTSGPSPSPVTTDRPSLAPYVGRSCRYASAATRTGSIPLWAAFGRGTGPAARMERVT